MNDNATVRRNVQLISEDDLVAARKILSSGSNSMRVPVLVSAWLLAVISSLFVPSSLALASENTRKEVDTEAYGRWKSFEGARLSPDGVWVAYVLVSRENSELVVRATRSDQEFHYRKYMKPEYDAVSGVIANAEFTADSRAVIFTISPSVQWHEKRQSEGHHIKTGFVLGWLSLPDGGVQTIPCVRSYAIPKEGSAYLAYQQGVCGNSGSKAKRSSGGHLVLLNLADGDRNRYIEGVASYAFDRAGSKLGYTIKSNNPKVNGVYIMRLHDGHVTVVATGRGDFRNFKFDQSGNQIAFLSTWLKGTHKNSEYALYYARAPEFTAVHVAGAGKLPASASVSPSSEVRFTREGNAIRFGTSLPLRLPVPPSATSATFDLWRWDKPLPLPQGLPSARNHAKSYLAIYDILSQRAVQLARPGIATVLLSENARYAVGIHQIAPEESESEEIFRTDGFVADIHAIDVGTGHSKLIRRIQAPKMQKPVGAIAILSPTGRYLLYFENRRWFSYDLKKRHLADLTGALMPAVRFDSETTLPRMPPEGIAGWTKGDNRVLLYSRRDIWEVDPSAKSIPRNITQGVGARENIVFRLWSDSESALAHPYPVHRLLESEQISAIDIMKPVLLSALDKDTMSSGIWIVKFGGDDEPNELIMRDKRIILLQKARYADQYLLTMETFREFPDLWTTSNFHELTKVSVANPQQREYRWGSAELIDFISDFGVKLKGVLYKPDGFDHSKKYPMIVSIYELASQDLHLYHAPQPAIGADGAIIASNLVSQGYLVLQPDIVSIAPYPGRSALASVVPAVQTVVDRGFVDQANIGLMGHSFGGYQTAYIVTQTDMFECASEGAGVTNMLSAYGSFSGRRAKSTRKLPPQVESS